jgi:hypothetical protein
VNGERFDRFSRRLASAPMSRRGLIGAFGGALAAAAGTTVFGRGPAHAAPPECYNDINCWQSAGDKYHICNNGKCYYTQCGRCPQGQFCIEGQCLGSGGCFPECGWNQVCYNGQCAGRFGCDPECDEGEICLFHRCIGF